MRLLGERFRIEGKFLGARAHGSGHIHDTFVAEYEAVRIGLARALALGARRVTVRLDSELVSNQLSGRYKVKDTKLIERYLEVGQLLSRLDSVKFETIPREKNARADRLAQIGARMGR